MRYIIIGAGAVGGTIGGRLAESGRDVVLVARGAHLEALRRDGLRLLTPDSDLRLPVPAVSGPEELGELRRDDVLVLCVKSQDTASVLNQWARVAVAGGGTASEMLPVVCAQNGVENERTALRLFQNVYGLCVWLPSVHLEPGVVAANCTPQSGILTVGRYPDGVDDVIKQIGHDLGESRFDAPVVDDVMRWKYGKLLNNLGNAFDALTDLAADEELAERLTETAREEGIRALNAAGIPFVGTAERRAVQGEPHGLRRDPRRPARRRLQLAEPGARHRLDRDGLPVRRDLADRPHARRPDPGQRPDAAAERAIRRARAGLRAACRSLSWRTLCDRPRSLRAEARVRTLI